MSTISSPCETRHRHCKALTWWPQQRQGKTQAQHRLRQTSNGAIWKLLVTLVSHYHEPSASCLPPRVLPRGNTILIGTQGSSKKVGAKRPVPFLVALHHFSFFLPSWVNWSRERLWSFPLFFILLLLAFLPTCKARGERECRVSVGFSRLQRPSSNLGADVQELKESFLLGDAGVVLGWMKNGWVDGCMKGRKLHFFEGEHFYSVDSQLNWLNLKKLNLMNRGTG